MKRIILAAFALALATPSFAGSSTVNYNSTGSSPFRTTTDGSSNNLSNVTIWDSAAGANGAGVDSSHGFLVDPASAAAWGVGATGSGVPANATYLGIVSGGNLVGWTGAVTNAGTFATQLTGSTNNINNIAGTISLPTGAATSALQTTGNTALTTINTTLGSPMQTSGGSVTANAGTNWGVGATGSGVPANATYLGIVSGGNLVGWTGAVTNAGTFATQLTGSTNNINNIAGTISLPTGAATSALQTTGNTALTTINTTLGSPMQTSGGSVTANAGTNLNTSALATAANQITNSATTSHTCSTGGFSMLGCLGQIDDDVKGAIPAGANNIGFTGVYGATYNTVAASQSAQALTGGSGGATGDYLSHCVVIPTSTSPGVVTIKDSSTTVYAFPGGSSSLSNLVPFTIPVGAKSVSGAWTVTTGASLSAVCVGKFT